MGEKKTEMSNREAIRLLSMIKVDSLGNLEPLHTWYKGIDKDIREAIKLAKKALLQPKIIHCKECKYAKMTFNGECKYCDIWFPDESCYLSGDNFCSSAERKET